MKKILGLDLGTTSIGWAFVREAEKEGEKSSIIKIGVRVNPLTTDEQTDFEKGKSVSSNADRTLKRGARRNLDRYKLRRNNLIEALKESKLITDETILAESDKATTHSTYLIRSKAATEKIEKEEFARVLLMINKKRGYKSSRKAKNEDEGQVIDGMAVAKTLYEQEITPGEYCYQILKSGKKHLPDFYRSDLKAEFEKVVQNCLLIAQNISHTWVSAVYDSKQRMQKMVFPDGVLYNKQKGVVRTPKVNFIFNEIPLLASHLAEKEKSDSEKNRLKSSYVPETGFEPAHPCEYHHLKVACLPISTPGQP